ncbi:unnamed protein product [Rhizoctonia solani]|uniref:Uncharacterized protein n=1 Tax=Rhizoctonia solani TaxID=456999 RepID=A0A8H2XBP6_9AGAM|nr:unnamed protein product [Rhizoctonia solani]
MNLSGAAHLEVLAERLSVKDVPDSLSVPIHLRCLKLGGSIENSSTHHLDFIVPRLTHLNCLYWQLDFVPDNFYCFSASSQLKSVHLLADIFSSASSDEDEDEDEDSWIAPTVANNRILAFTNLTHFSLKSEDLPYGIGDHLGLLTSLLQSSPNLESIILDIQGTTHSERTYSPTSILKSLGDQFVLPHLHTLHMLGDTDPDWFGFVTKPTHHLRAFLARNTSIRDLAIGCPLEDVSGGEMDPDDLSQLLPSVKRLACPFFLCEAVVTSELASRLESLVITNQEFYEDNPLGSVAEAMGEDTLPNLRKLAIWADMSNLGIGELRAFVSAARELEELEVRIEVEDYKEFLSALSGAENIRRIKMNKPGLGASVTEWETLMVELAETCPRLEVVTTHEEGGLWKVVRAVKLDKPSIVKVDFYASAS